MGARDVCTWHLPLPQCDGGCCFLRLPVGDDASFNTALSTSSWLPHCPPTPLLPSRPPDFKNVSIVGNYIKDRTKNAQFVIISLRNNMFELADRLVGIYK